MNSSSEELVQEDGNPGTPLKQTKIFVRELTCAANVLSPSVRSKRSKRQDRDALWTLTGTTMKAYVAMRGLPDIEDPLMMWIASLETDQRVEGEVTYVKLPTDLHFASES